MITDEVNYGEELGQTTGKLAARAGHVVVGRGDFDGRPDAAVNFARQQNARARTETVIVDVIVKPILAEEMLNRKLSPHQKSAVLSLLLSLHKQRK